MAAQREAELVAQKRIICEFLNSINYDIVVKLKTIKQQYPIYNQFRANIEMINGRINDATKDLKWSFKQNTKDVLNQNLTNLRAQLEYVTISKSFVDNTYNDYIIYGGKLSVSEFFSESSYCEVLVHTTAQVVDIDNAKIVNTNTYNGTLVEATRIHNKYLKYKQKYLNLKNKIN